MRGWVGRCEFNVPWIPLPGKRKDFTTDYTNCTDKIKEWPLFCLSRVEASSRMVVNYVVIFLVSAYQWYPCDPW